MKIAVMIIRILMGLLFLFSSAVVLFNLIPQPELEWPVKTFNEGIAASVYLIPMLKIIELIVGVAFLSGWFISLASIVIFPVTVNIFLFHAFLSHEGLPVALFLLTGNVLLLYTHRKNYVALLAIR